jgi:septal ring factor EnvC (AmiA/AmiB activator)
MLFFTQSDEELLAENLNRVESENANLREQIEDMERELDFKERKVTEMEAELKVLRSERE